MPIIVSGGDNTPLVTAKRKKKREEVAPVFAAADVSNLTAAHFSLTGRYPSPEKAMTLLQLGSDKPRTVEDWKTLLDPESLIPEVTGVPTVEKAQYEVGRRSVAPFEPSATDKQDEMAGPTGVRSFWSPIRNAFGLDDEDDIDPVAEIGDKVRTSGMTGKPLEWTPTPTREAPKVKATISDLTDAVREYRDKDMTPAERGAHDAVVGNVRSVAADLAGRLRSVDLQVNYDLENPDPRGVLDAYRQYIYLSQTAPLILGSDSQRKDAVEVISAAYGLPPGEDPGRIIGTLDDARATLKNSGVLDPAVLDVCYRSHLAGRPFGQSDVKAHWDYVYLYGRDKLTPEGEKTAKEHEENLSTWMQQAWDAINVGGVLEKGVGAVEHGINTVLDATTDSVVWVANHTTYAGDEEGQRQLAHTAATLKSVTHWLSKTVAQANVVELARPAFVALTMAEMALGVSAVKDGGLVLLYGEGEEVGFDPDVLFRAEAWQAAWDANEGKLPVNFLAERGADAAGVSLEEHPYLAELVQMADFALAIFGGAKCDNVVIPRVVEGAKVAWSAARAADEALVAATAPERMAKLRARLSDQTGHMLDAPERMFGVEEYIGEGQQAGLEIGIDTTATKTAPVAEARPKAPEEMPGQVGMEVPEAAPTFKPGDRVTDVLEQEFDTPQRVSGEVVEVMDDGATLRVKLDKPVRKEGEVVDELLLHPNRVQKVAKSESGVTVAETAVGQVDASVAPDVAAINKAGYKTFGSHGAKADHPSRHPAKKVKPYVEFDLAANKGKVRAIGTAAKKVGLAVERSDDGKHIIVSADDVDQLHDFTEALTGKTVEGAGAGGPGSTAPAPATEPPPRPKVHRFFYNHAEVIAYVLDNPSLIARIYRIPDVPEFKPFVQRLADAKTPEAALDIMGEMKLRGLVPDAMDFYASGLWDLARSERYVGHIETGIGRVFSSPAFINGRRMPTWRSERHIQDLGLASKMGRRGKMTKADRAWLMKRADEAYFSDDPYHVYEKVAQRIVENMKEEGIWEDFLTFRNKILKSRARGAASAYERAYTHNFKTRNPERISALMAERDELVALLDETVDKAARHELHQRIEAANKFLNETEEAARIITGKRADGDTHTVDWAQKKMEDLSYPTPFLDTELAAGYSLPFDPRIMAWFHSGTSIKWLSRWDAFAGDRIMGIWKKIVMSSPLFAVRVYGKDEGLRLISEGIVPGSKTWRDALARRDELFGGQRSRIGRSTTAVRNVGKKLRGAEEEGAWIKLSKAEGDEYDELRALAEPDKAQQARLDELASKAEGTLSEWERQLVEGAGGMDMAMQALSNHFQLLRPGEPGYANWLHHNIAKMNAEPIAQLFLKTRLSERDDIVAWLEHIISADDKSGAFIRTKMAQKDIITPEELPAQNMRRLLDSDDPIGIAGAAGNVSRFVESWSEILQCLASDRRLRRAVQSPGSLPFKTLEQMVSDNPGKFWDVPAHMDAIFKGGFGSAVNPARQPLQWFYENVSMRIMEGLGQPLREIMFSHKYDEEIRALAKLDISEGQVRKIAFERALDYADSRTFTRNPTIIEDAMRNVLPFVNSYRQFWVYWGKMLARHPFAMRAAYDQNPWRDDFGVRFGDRVFYGLPTGAFWMEPEGGLSGVTKANIMNFNPWMAMPFVSLAGASGLKLEGLPLFSEDYAFSPLGAEKALVTGLNQADNKFAQLFVGDMSSYKSAHSYLVKHYAERKGEAVPEGGELKVDWPWHIDLINFLTRNHSEYPEYLFQAISRHALGTLSENPKRVAEIRGGMQFLGNPSALASYRAKHPDFDTLQSFYEAEGKEKVAIAVDHPWVLDFAPSSSRYEDGVYTFSNADYYAARAGGEITTLSTREQLQAIASSRLRYLGGHKKGSVVEYPSYLSYQDAAAITEQKVKDSTVWAEAIARQVSAGSEGYYEQLMSIWKKDQPDGDQRKALPGIFHLYAMKEAKAQGVEWPEYERTLSPTLIEQDFAAAYPDNYLYSERGYDSDLERIEHLIKMDIGLLGQRSFYMKNSKWAGQLESRAVDSKVETLKGLADTSSDAFYNLGSERLRSQGIDCGPAIDLAIAKVQRDYWNKLVVIGKEHGTSSRAYRDAKLKHDAYKDRVLSKVKGGEALVGGLADRILHIPYFTEPNYASVGRGPNAEKQQHQWNEYKREVTRLNPDMEKVKKLHNHFTPYDEDRYQEFMRVNHMLYTAAMARHLRAEMKRSYSDYYGGPGNSVYSTEGKKMVAQLSAFIRDLIRDDKRRWGASAFAKDITTYYSSPHSFAWTALEWYSH